MGGIYHQDSDNLFVNCLCYDNTLYGLYASGNNNDLSYCESSDNGDYGILIDGNNPSLLHCIIRNNVGYGCKIIGATSNFQIQHSTFEENQEGLIIEDCANGEIGHCTIAHNNLDPFYYSSGLLLDTSINTIIHSNIIEDNYNGILLLSNSHDNEIRDCRIQASRMYGIYVINLSLIHI